MATRTSTTRTMSALRAPSADISAASAMPPFTLDDLASAYFDCRKSKRNSINALQFEINLERNLTELRDQLLNGTYTIGQTICFVITRPKPREVWAGQFRDRIVHHLLYNHLAPIFEPTFIADSCACIPGRGTLYAAQRLEHKIRSATQNWSQSCYYLKCDLANFFVSIDKRILRHLLLRSIAHPWWRALADRVLMHDPRQNHVLQSSPHKMALVPEHKRLSSQPPHLGLPIGNLSSQFFANIYLNELDQFVKHTLRARHYIRYVDDFVILHPDARWLNNARQRIERLLAEHLHQQLNPTKTIIQPVVRGVDFVGQVIKPWCRTTRKRTRNEAITRVQQIPAAQLRETANSYFGLLRQATHSHQNRVKLAKALMLRGKAVNVDLTKTYKGNAHG